MCEQDVILLIAKLTETCFSERVCVFRRVRWLISCWHGDQNSSRMEEDSQSTFETLLNAEENGERTADWEERENEGGKGRRARKTIKVLCCISQRWVTLTVWILRTNRKSFVCLTGEWVNSARTKQEDGAIIDIKRSCLMQFMSGSRAGSECTVCDLLTEKFDRSRV